MWITPRSCSTDSAAIVHSRTRWRRISASPARVPGSSTCTAAHHRQVLGLGARAERHRGRGRRRQHPVASGQLEQVRRVAAAHPFDVVGVHRAAAEGGVRVLQRQRLVEAVGVDRQLHVVTIRDVERAADLLRPGADVLVDLESGPAARERVLDRPGSGRRGAHQHGHVDRDRVERRPHHRLRLGRVRAEVPDRAEVLGDERGQPSGQRGVADLRREQVHVAVDAAGRHHQPARVEDGRAGVEHDVDPVHRVRVPGPAERDDAAVADADRCRPHAQHRVEHQAADDGHLDAAPLGPDAEAVAHRVAPAGDDLVGPGDVVGSGITRRSLSPSLHRGRIRHPR